VFETHTQLKAIGHNELNTILRQMSVMSMEESIKSICRRLPCLHYDLWL